MNSDKLNIANQIIKKQDELIDSFDSWVRFVKTNDLTQASEVVKESNKLRTEIIVLKKLFEKLNKKSGIILLIR
jgi:phenylpropionate dioxygenase-like ring-hydroxylating dioxygenase large terminal subunit